MRKKISEKKKKFRANRFNNLVLVKTQVKTDKTFPRVQIYDFGNCIRLL